MLELFGAIFPVVSDMPIDSDALVVILSISGEYVCMYVSICIYTVFRKKKRIEAVLSFSFLKILSQHCIL